MRIAWEYTGLPAGCELNPLQETLVPIMDAPENVVVAAPTASGKSLAITMFGRKHLLEGRRVLYIGVMRALAREKFDDWSSPGHPWASEPKAIVSGDYVMDDARVRELEAARVVCITPEALASRLRHVGTARGAWLREVGLVVADETHLLSDGKRGANLEAALMEFSAVVPEAQLVALSATMPNVEQIAEWFTRLNGRRTIVRKSDYRPVPLTTHFVRIVACSSERFARERIACVLDIIAQRPGEQFLVCVWQKAFGFRLLEALRGAGVRADFHNANHGRAERARMESDFKLGNLDALVTTSTLFVGVNLPARNVIVTAVQAAGDDVRAHVIQQAMGRAGRPQYDTEGDAFVLVPNADADRHADRIMRGEPIRSQLARVEHLATHFLGAVYLGWIRDEEGFAAWFDRSLAQLQRRMDVLDRRNLLESLVDEMRRREMLRRALPYGLTHMGTIAAQMYMCPFHLSDAVRNFRQFAMLDQPTDTDLAVALGCCRGFEDPNVSRQEERALPYHVFAHANRRHWKAVGVLYYRLRAEPVPECLANVNFTLYDDLPRLHACIERVNEEVEHWEGLGPERLDVLFTRAIQRCDGRSAEMAVRKVSRTERKRLHAVGIYGLQDMRANPAMVAEVLGPDRLVQMGLEQPTPRAPLPGTFVARRGFGGATK